MFSQRLRTTPLQSVTFLALSFAGAFAHAEEVLLTPEHLEFFEKQVRPILVEQCLKCHSATGEKVKGGLLLDNRASILKGGDSGAAAIPGNPAKSLLIEAVRYADEDLQMPPKHRLTPEQVTTLEKWVSDGLPDPRIDPGAGSPKLPGSVSGKDFWSFQPVKDPTLPEPARAGWAFNPIDKFILHRLEEKGLEPNPDVEKRLLLRRATYDLTGLPPTPEEMQTFLDDHAADAFEKVVDRLLSSPRYGEQWGRHWLDVVRYADTAGCNSDFPIASAFRYRNYVIDSFNRDKPYDVFLREQIAGDLLPAATEAARSEQVIATGYLAIARRFGSGAKDFNLTIDDAIDNLGKAMLGLSLGCARCHDHKFDPVPTKDYYALYGIFDSTTFAFPGTELFRHQKDFVILAPPDVAARAEQEAAELSGLDAKIQKLKEAKTRAEREEEQLGALPQNDPRSRAFIGPVLSTGETRRSSLEVAAEIKAAIERQHQLELSQDSVEKAYAVSEGTPHNCRIQKKGDPSNLGEEAPRGFLTVLGGQTVPPEDHGSGRKELADWLADPRNPLTGRVMLNRIWQHHFGRGLVRTTNDFGVRGEPPTSPELLDWLTTRFVEGAWSVKSIHRLIMLSHAYRMSSDDNPANSRVDVANDLLWRFNRQRLSAEELRDSLLSVSGAIDLAPGTAHPFPPSAQWHFTQHNPFVADYPTSKRSVFLLQQRIRKQPYLDIFDGADTNTATGVRPLSTTPIQALFMMNNEFAHQMAARLATRVESACSEEAGQIDLAYRLVLGRPAEASEMEDARAYLGRVAASLQGSSIPMDQQAHAAFASFARVLLSCNEFLFVE